MTETPAAELSGLEALWADSEFSLYRGQQPGSDAPVLVLASATGQRTSANLRWLEHEHSLANKLDSAWAAKPLTFARHEGRTVLVLEDPGGDPLRGMLGRPFELTHFLQIAIALTAALNQVHQSGLIHMHVRPENVLVDAADRVWLTGFGMASQLRRERQAPAPPEVIAGTFAYMAPEQTGRMNRSIDARSDLYALGVILYEMATGVLPFTAADPMEWMHSHIAKRPMRPSERVADIPDAVDVIILKLLAKTGEDRYQTAAGVESDLHRCLAAWRTDRRIEPFAPGARDVSERLLVPEKLYGREAEIEALVAAFDRVAKNGETGRILLSGHGGVGKSSLVDELHRFLVPSGALFAAGKFDQYARDIPYATLAQAFQSLVRQLLSKNDADLNRWRIMLLEALGPNGQLMVNMIPELALIVGGQPSVVDLRPGEEKQRFLLAFRRMLGVFARSEHPLVLFLDDMQWIDLATAELFERIVTEPEIGHLLVVGAYRDNEIGPAHPLARMLETVADARGGIQELRLDPLTFRDVGRLLADALHVEPDHVQPLAELIFEKTGGNPFFTTQFINALADEGLLAFDPAVSAWTWDLERIRAKGITDNVADLMAARLGRLSECGVQILKCLACLGNSAQTPTLRIVLGKPEEEIDAAFVGAVRAGLVSRLDSAYAFIHDRIHEAAYALIPDAERSAAHLKIGRALVAGLSPEEWDEKVFEITTQLNRGAALIDTPEEQRSAAEFNLRAGKRAKASAAYTSALMYFVAGDALLAEDRWETERDLAFDLNLQRAECEFLTGELVAAEERLTDLSQRAASVLEMAAITRLRVALYTTLNRFGHAIEVGLAYLNHIGLECPLQPTDEDVRSEYEKMQRLLARRPIEELIDAPLMSDPHWRATMDVLSDLMPPLLYTKGNLHDLLLLRAANISVEFGSCDGSLYAFARLHQVLGYRFGDYKSVFRFGQLALDFVDKRGLDRFKARVYMAFAIFVGNWSRHLPTSRILLARALEAANAIGDLTFAVYCAKHLTTNLRASGEPLRNVQREAEDGLAFARKSRFSLVVDAFIGELMLVRFLRGLPPDAVSAEDEESGVGWFELHLERSPHQSLPACWYWIYQMQARFFEQDYARALEAAAKANDLLWSSRAIFDTAEYYFYAALTHAAACDSCPPDARPQHIRTLSSLYRQISVWAENCPENFSNRKALVGAEIARLEGRELDAEQLYEEAICSAHTYAFIQNEAIAYERAAHFYAGRGLTTISDAYLRNARSCYAQWGADLKVHQLDQMHPHLRVGVEATRADSTVGIAIEHLDLETVVKVSQVVSSEIDFNRLIDTLMVIALEHAGADRGLLILPRKDELWIEAEALAVRDGIDVQVRRTRITAAALPESVLRYVARTQRSVLLADHPGEFADDAYIRGQSGRSVLCLPLIKQARLVGLLYVENSQTPHAFTPSRMSVLTLLASQAAISLENARLYADLQRAQEHLAEAQRLTHTGSSIFNVATQRYVWSEEIFRIYQYDPMPEVPFEMLLERAHPDDRDRIRRFVADMPRDGRDYELEHRLLMPDGSVKTLHIISHAVTDESGELTLVATTMDITASRQAQEALHKAQADLAHVARVTALGELAASIAHEVNQPLAAIIANGEASLRWLNRPAPEVDEVRRGVQSMVGDADRASQIIHRIRALSRKGDPERVPVSVNDTIDEVVKLTHHEVASHRIALRLDLAAGLPPVLGDRVQLQQVIINLLINGIQAMAAVEGRPRTLLIRSRRQAVDQVVVEVHDSGDGIEPEHAHRLFDPFFSTKPNGMGMGLSISRSIVEAHDGVIRASRRADTGSVFQVTLPSIRENAAVA